MKRILFFIAAITAVSCASFEREYTDRERHSISLVAHTDVSTKAPVTGTTIPYIGRTLQVAAYYNAVEGTSTNYFPATGFTSTNGSEWTQNENRFWPITGTLDMMGYSTTAAVYDVTWATNWSNGVTLTYPDNSTLQDDILVGAAQGATKDAKAMTFSHALSWIAVTASSNIAYNASGNAGITVTKVELKDAFFGGSLSATRSDAKVNCSWTPANQKTEGIAFTSTSVNLTATPQALGNGLLVTPITGKNFSIVLHYTLHNGKNGAANNDIPMQYTYTPASAPTMESGKKYTYAFNIALNAITVTPSLTEWTVADPVNVP